MKNNFSQYYRPNDEEFELIWRECLFVFDTNVLLNLYRYSDKTREELIQILKSIGHRIWIPYQVALEYQENRLIVILTQDEAYQNIQMKLDNKFNEIKNELTPFSKHHSIDIDRLIERIGQNIEEIKEELNKSRRNAPNWFENDQIREIIDSLFENRVGEAFSQEKLKSIFEEGEKRYQAEIPPGYKDIDKKNNAKDSFRMYGDLIIWFQIIEKAKEVQKPIIFITDEKKEDWWHKIKGRTVGPRVELIKEFNEEATEIFYMYQVDKFMEYARQYISQVVSQEAINEIKEMKRKDIINNIIDGGQRSVVVGSMSSVIFVGAIGFVIDGRAEVADNPPVLQSGEIFASVKMLKQLFNLSFSWNEEGQVVVLEDQRGREHILIPKIINGTAYLSTRVISSIAGYSYSYDSEVQAVSFTK